MKRITGFLYKLILITYLFTFIFIRISPLSGEERHFFRIKVPFLPYNLSFLQNIRLGVLPLRTPPKSRISLSTPKNAHSYSYSSTVSLYDIFPLYLFSLLLQ